MQSLLLSVVQEFEPNTLLEIEGTQPKFVYIVMQGSLTLFKRPESMYDTEGYLINVDEIEFQSNPKDSGNSQIGQKMTTIKHGLVGEDAVIFNQKLAYSIKSNERVNVLRARADQAKKWP